MKAQLIQFEDTLFPTTLRSELIKPPVAKLWYRGVWRPSHFTKCAAVVGSRRMSRYGRQATEEIVVRLVGAGYTIVSGLMYGVDQLAHSVCLEHGGQAIGVLGYGITYRSEDGAMKLAERIVNSGGLILSEYEGNTVSQMWMFPQRNRIVAGLSDITIVVEAGRKSGSMITAKLARKMGREVYAVPGPIFSPTSEGTNLLLFSGKATPLTLDTLALLTGVTTDHDINEMLRSLTAGEREVYMKIKMEGPHTANEIARLLSIPAPEIIATLVLMEMNGLVAEERGVWHTI